MSHDLKKTESITEIFDAEKVQHLTNGFYPKGDKLVWDGDSLPYHQLGGPGLERLCYLLLLTQGKVPRYFGNLGQKQYGIDLLVTDDDEYAVYQCKNLESLSEQDIKQAFQHFEEEWLGRTYLPKPKQFVLVCPLPLRERKQNETWTTLERQFHERTEVGIEFWDRNYLDERLRRLPDVVSDLFSDQAAERFCDLEDWNSDLFRPVAAGSGERAIARYLEKKAAGQIYVAAKLAEDFTEKLERNGSLLIQGLPGSGKTITGLALTESFHDSRCRIFYVSLRHDIDEDTLVEGIRRRLSRPTIFLLDDCHGKFELLDLVQNRLSAVIRGNGFLVFLARTTPTPEDMLRVDNSDFEEDLEEAEAVLELQPTLAVFSEIITRVKPHFAELSKERLLKIFEFTGHDLLLLDQLLATIDSVNEIDQLKLEKVFEKTLKRYFRKSLGHRPEFMKLAALAQFDIAPPVSYFHSDLEKQDEDAATQLVVRADRRPSRYFFLHSSAAELIFRAMVWNSGRDDHPELAADYLIEFFKNSRESDKQLVVDFSTVIGNRLKLTADWNDVNRLRSRFLTDDCTFTFVEESFKQLPLNLLAVCFSILKCSNVKTFTRYHDFVQRKIEDGTVINMAIARLFSESGQFLQMVKIEYPLLFPSLQSQLADRGLRSLIKMTQFQNVLSFLRNFAEPEDSQWITSLDMIPDNEFYEMIQRTIDSSRSIGTIHLVLWELKKTNPALLEKLERKIGAKHYLHLITSAGTIFELFMVIRYSSLSISGELIDALDAETLNTLIDKTIASGRSIGTIPFTLRELKKTNQVMLGKLERRIGTKCWWQLLCANGTMSVLMQILQCMDKSFRRELVRGSQDLFVEQWQGLLLRGDFYDLALFVRWSSLVFSKQFTAAFLISLKPTFEALIRRDGWKVLNRGAPLLAASPESSIKKYLSALLRDYLSTVDLSSLCFNSFDEAAHCVRLLWYEVPSHRKELTDSLLRILPEEKAWYANEDFLHSTHLLFFILANPQAKPEDARRVLAIGNSKEVAALCSEATTLDLFLYVWNLYILWFEWERTGNESFATFLHSKISDILSRALVSRSKNLRNPEKTDQLLTLAGLLSFVGLTDNPTENAEWLSKLPSFSELLKRVQTKTFVLGVFYLLGLERIFDGKDYVPRQTWRRLLPKADEYSEKLAALEHLCNFVRTRARE